LDESGGTISGLQYIFVELFEHQDDGAMEYWSNGVVE
jgi:hypothetical protein